MIGRSLVAGRSLLAVFSGCLGLGLMVAGAAAAEFATTGQQVREALHREVYGLQAEKQQLLDAVLAESPDAAQARWHRGYVKQGQQWVTPAEAAKLTEDDPRLAAYRHRREALDDTVAEHLSLADWCRSRGLSSQERAHLERVIQLAPDHAVARERLEFERVGLDWVSRSEIEEGQRRYNERLADLAKWQSASTKYLKRLASHREQVRDQAAEDIAKIERTDAIAALELMIAPHSEPAAAAAIAALGNMTDPRAMEALARIAIFAPWQTIRVDAAERLSRWPVERYAPLLLAEMYLPLETRIATVSDGRGRLLYRHACQREGQQERQQLVLDTAYQFDGGNPALAQFATLGMMGNQIVQREWAAHRQNQYSFQLNSRIADCLNVATGQQMPPNPKWWWTWWNDYNEVFVTGEKQVKLAYVAEQVSVVTPPPRTGGDCLVAGTLVWTQAGMQPIETIRLGDLVLAQDVDTGELAYKPVLRTTVRPAGPLVRLQIGGKTVETSGGHPFWVTGEGWVKARDLQSGARLHGLEHASAVAEVSLEPDQETYNLEVADFHTYFITDRRLLSHDNTPRQPTQAVVPGLQP